MSEDSLPPTSNVGIRALQQHASAVVARVAAGERIVVTDRGRPAALLVPLPGAGLERLVVAGLAVATVVLGVLPGLLTDATSIVTLAAAR